MSFCEKGFLSLLLSMFRAACGIKAGTGGGQRKSPCSVTWSGFFLEQEKFGTVLSFHHVKIHGFRS